MLLFLMDRITKRQMATMSPYEEFTRAHDQIGLADQHLSDGLGGLTAAKARPIQ